MKSDIIKLWANSSFLKFAIVLILSLIIIVACGGGGGGGAEDNNDKSEDTDTLCRSENCTDAQLENNFARAITELEEEGLVITRETITTDPVVYYAILNRMLRIAGAEKVVQQDLIAGVKQTAVDPFEPFDNTVEYCGPGKSVPGGAYTMPNPGFCMNRICWAHDNCYGTTHEGNDSFCSWTAATEFCDDQFFEDYNECVDAGLCGLTCRSVYTIASGLYSDEWLAQGIYHDLYCTECTPMSEDESCAAIGAECGQAQNGCGQTIDCGSHCPQLMTCGFYDGMDNKCGNINLKGTWYDNVGYTVTIEGAGNSYVYTGTNGVYKHTGTIGWTGAVFEGNVTDVEDWCCGNHGYLWLTVVDQNTIEVSSTWESPAFHAGPDKLKRKK